VKRTIYPPSRTTSVERHPAAEGGEGEEVHLTKRPRRLTFARRHPHSLIALGHPQPHPRLHLCLHHLRLPRLLHLLKHVRLVTQDHLADHAWRARKASTRIRSVPDRVLRATPESTNRALVRASAQNVPKAHIRPTPATPSWTAYVILAFRARTEDHVRHVKQASTRMHQEKGNAYNAKLENSRRALERAPVQHVLKTPMLRPAAILERTACAIRDILVRTEDPV
jgi:hypothetical protein